MSTRVLSKETILSVIRIIDAEPIKTKQIKYVFSNGIIVRFDPDDNHLGEVRGFDEHKNCTCTVDMGEYKNAIEEFEKLFKGE